MRGKKVLATILLAVGLCFVSALGYGEIAEWMDEAPATYIEIKLLSARITYVMANPTSFLIVDFSYDPTGLHGRMAGLPEGVETKGKISVVIGDNRGIFSHKSKSALLDQFEKELEGIYSYIQLTATDMDNDIVARFYSEDDIPLGYFYQGEYYLWEK